MKTISTYVQNFMQEYPFLSKFLRQGIVNYKALARRIEPEISKAAGQKVSVGAIAVSLQRLKARDQDKLYTLIGRLRGVTVITGVSALTVTDIAAERALTTALFESTAQLDSAFFILVRSHVGMVFFVEKTVCSSLLKASNANYTVKETTTYAALIISREILHPTEVGGLSYPLQVLAEHGIAVKALSATFTEEVLFLDEAIADRAASVLRHAMWR